MNKHDIEELQAFLQGEYIEESTSRSLKEVKQYQKDVSSNKDTGDITKVRKVLKSKLENDNTNNDYGRYNGKREVYDKTPAIRESIRIYLYMKRSECKNSDELYAFNYVDKVLSGSNKTEVKNKMCRLVGLNPKIYGMDLYKHQPGEYFSINFIENATKQRQIFPTEINKYRYFHFSKTGNLHNVGLSSSRSTIHGGGSIIYPSKCIFFYAVEKTANLDNVLARMIAGDPRGKKSVFFYGNYVYEYIPKKSDKIYIDSTDDSNLLQLQQKTRNHGFFKVFLNLDGEGRSSVPVKEFNFSIDYNRQNIMNQEETKLLSYTARLEDIYDWNPKQVNKVLDIFEKYINDHEANPNSPKPKKEFDASLKSLADSYRNIINQFIDEEKIPQEERRLFKKNAYGHFHKILKTKLNKRFEYRSNDYKTLTKYFHESYIDATIDRFDAFMEEFNNGQIGDNEFIMESAQDDRYAKITQDYIKKSGRASLRYKRGEDYLPQEVVDRIVYLCNKLLEFPANGNYNQYKTYYDTLCKIVHHPNTTNISYDVLDKAVYSGYINFGMNAGGKRLQHRCYLKPGTRLYHTSESGNMSILKPNVFIGDDVFYAAPRIYFYCEAIGGRYGSPSKPVEYDANNKPIITEEMERRFKHVYMYTVKPGDSIFFDNELNSEKNTICGAVYLAYTKPIKLTKIY